MMAERSNVARRTAREAEHRRRVEEAEARARKTPRHAEESLAIGGAYARGLAPGFVRGLYHQAQGLAELAPLSLRMANPALDRILSRPGTSVLDEAARRVAATEIYVVDRATHPAKLKADLNQGLSRANASLNPTAGPPATAEQRKRRAYEAGKNGGEFVSNLATLPIGAGEVKILRELGHLGKVPTVETYLAKGEPLKVATNSARPYTGRQGSHYMPQRWDLPKVIADSPFNRIMPARGATTGQMNAFHYSVDDRLQGGRLKGGGGWSGKRLGWTRPPLPNRLWRGMPLPTKGVLFGTMVGLGGVVSDDRQARAR